MRRVLITMLATFAMVLSGMGVAGGHDGDRSAGERDVWSAQHDQDSGDTARASSHQDGKNEARRGDRKQDDRRHDDRKRDRDKPTEPEEPDERCPGGIEIPLDDLAYVCLYLLTEADPEAQCPEGTIEVELRADPLANLCLVLFLDGDDGGNGLLDGGLLDGGLLDVGLLGVDLGIVRL